MTSKASSDRQRDAASLQMLGSFFAILGLAVSVGTLWELHQPRAAFVNVASALVLIGVGVGMIAAARRLKGRGAES